MSRRALVIAHDAASGAGMLGSELEARGFELETFVVCPDVDRPEVFRPFPQLDGYDLVVPMGAVWSVYDDPTIGSWIGDEMRLLRRAHDQGIPVLGICFGGQALAAALGGLVEAAPETEIGWMEIDVHQGCPVSAGPWMQWHHDRFRAPHVSTVLARSAVGPQLFRMGRSVGTQFHPEVDSAHLERWLDYASAEYLAEHGVDPDRLRSDTAANQPGAAGRCSQLVDWFLEVVGID